MNVAGLRIRITFQKNTETEDAIGNTVMAWEDVFTCWASASAEKSAAAEGEAATTIVDIERVDFTVRYSTETAAVTAKEYRIVYQDRIYDIVLVDDMGFKKRSLKFYTERRVR